ncbi:MAG: cytochrome c biogenesis protein ResB [Spirochaetes bacterium]|nr:cytochrome c biogenesis protein ResB [Spirochaetota bacterium]
MKVYKFLISPKFVILLLLAISVLSILGIFIPQGEGDLFYAKHYGLGKAVLFLGLNNLYNLWFYKLLYLFLGIDLILCSVKRIGYLRKIFSNPEEELNLKPNRYEKKIRLDGGIQDTAVKICRLLKHSFYRVKSKRIDNGNKTSILAGRGKISTFGSTIVHGGILIIIFYTFFWGTSGYGRYVKIVEGNSYVEPSENFLVRVDKIRLDYYKPGKDVSSAGEFRLKNAQATLSVLKDGSSVQTTRTLRIGERLKYKGINFKLDYKGFGWAYRILLTNSSGWQWTLSVWPWNPVISLSKLNWMIYLHNLYPDFALDDKGNPYSKTPYLRNPAAKIWIQQGTKKPELIGWLKSDAPLKFKGYTLKMVDLRPYASVYVSKKPGIPFIWAGFGLIIAGLLLIYGLDYRIIRIIVSTGRGAEDILITGTSTKTGNNLKKDIETIAAGIEAGKEL